MRILHVIRSDGWAGVERHVAELAQVQHSRGHAVTVIGGDPARMRSVIGPDVRHLPAAAVRHVIGSLAQSRRHADIINTHMTAADLVTAAFPRPRGTVVVSTRHFAARRGSSPALRPLFRTLGRGINGQIAVSRYVAERIDGPSTVVLSGVRSDPGLALSDARDKVVLVAQRLEREKRTEDALVAFAEAAITEDGWRLQVAGDGSMRAELEVLAARLGVGDAVDFLGFRDDLPDLMRRAGMMLAPLEYEAFGLSVVEAMARGLPVVAAAAGAHLETVGTVAGAAMYAPNDPHDAARALRVLAESSALRDEYGKRLQAAQREHFTVEQQALRTEAAYRSLM
jgi:glycosyltransferase involved in cell wall biosynthesis